jgi:ATP-dependent helicase/nuclease subunit A
MSERRALPDEQARIAAETTFDRNVVVVAGAGTGKTTLLVNRLVHLLMKEPHPLALARIVALTFTNKAATEMKVRLRDRLLALIEPGGGAQESGAVGLEDLRARYGLSADAVADRARAALRDLERAQIGTLHSFAAHLLRLYPIESGVDPGFREHDGSRFEEHFAAQWDWWLDAELGPAGPNHEAWRRALAELLLEEVRALASALCGELVPLDALRRQLARAELPPALRDWFAARRARAAELLAAHDGGRRRKAEAMLAAAVELFARLEEEGLRGLEGLDQGTRDQLARDPGSATKGWSEEAFAEATDLIRAAQSILAVDVKWTAGLVGLLLPFVERVRAAFLEQGWVSFDGLLARARALLRDHPSVRERLKEEYQAILVDEFQDTDPAQYEIVLFLAERAGRCAPTWREVEPAPGKLCIVGDPKQSIYAFRRADIEAFDRVVERLRAAGAQMYELVTNFRSHAAVLDAVNGVFDRLFREEPHVQPANVPLAALPGRRAGFETPGVELRLVTSGEEETDSGGLAKLEAEALARWLKEEVLGRELLRDAAGRRVAVQPGHVALLFRKLTQSQDYLEALRRRGVRYVTDGEKHFYRRQEVVDLINLLRAVENPHDRLALVGLLRSPVGGVTDRELVELADRDALDYRRPDRLAGWGGPRAAAVRLLYERLGELHREAGRRTLPEAVDLLFARLPVLELAAASLHGEQAVANLFKLRQMAVELADRPTLTLAGFAELMAARQAEQPDEAESALAEESPEAVRVLTIHKAKGLEFPIVILPGLHQGTGGGRVPPTVAEDWSTGVLGLSVGSTCSLGAVLVADKARRREEAERRRLLYVGMTRARELLVLSGGRQERAGRGAFLALLEEACGGPVWDEGEAVTVGRAAIRKRISREPERPPTPTRPRRGGLRAPTGLRELADRWAAREAAWREALAAPRRLTPSALTDGRRPERARRAGAVRGQDRGDDRPPAALIGTLLHRLLERWAFDRGLAQLDERLAEIGRGLPPEWAERAPAIAEALAAMMRTFVASPPYAELARATVLARECPFAMAWGREARGPVMEGTIDLLYRLDGRLWIADYKTDQVGERDLAQRAEQYRPQMEVYRAAAAQALGVAEVGGRLIFVRAGRAVDVGGGRGA